MKMRAKSVAWLLPFFLTGCFHFHKAQQQQAQALAPPASTEPAPAPAHPDLPDSAVTIPPQPVKTSADAVEVTPKARQSTRSLRQEHPAGCRYASCARRNPL